MGKDDSFVAKLTTDQLIANIVAKLRNNDQMDSELLNILFENIVKLAPVRTAVDDAVTAIEGLATERAEKSDDDLPDYD